MSQVTLFDELEQQLDAIVNNILQEQWEATEPMNKCIDKFISTVTRKTQEAHGQQMQRIRNTLHAKKSTMSVAEDIKRLVQKQNELKCQATQVHNELMECQSQFDKQVASIYKECSNICERIGHAYRPFTTKHFVNATDDENLMLIQRCLYCGEWEY
jgi:uncharacterized coiled-coil DUF342 family protein